jgi:hypothetical protein
VTHWSKFVPGAAAARELMAIWIGLRRAKLLRNDPSFGRPPPSGGCARKLVELGQSVDQRFNRVADEERPAPSC